MLYTPSNVVYKKIFKGCSLYKINFEEEYVWSRLFFFKENPTLDKRYFNNNNVTSNKKLIIR